MSRPKKAIVDYFPHFINHKKTISILENQFGNDGYAFWFKTLEILGSTEHHFINCNEPTQWLFLLSKTLVSEETANNILNLLAEMDAIDKEFWNKKIIRSQNFIDNLIPVYQRREINVYTKKELRGLLLTKNSLNGVVVNKKPHSKVKESKEEKSKVNIYNKFCNEIMKKYSLKITNKKDLKEYFSLFGGYEGFFKMVDRYFIYYNAFKLHGWDLQYRYGNGWHNFIDHMADFKTDGDLRDKLESKGKRKIKKKLSPFGTGSDELLEKGLRETAALIKRKEEEKKNGSVM